MEHSEEDLNKREEKGPEESELKKEDTNEEEEKAVKIENEQQQPDSAATEQPEPDASESVQEQTEPVTVEEQTAQTTQVDEPQPEAERVETVEENQKPEEEQPSMSGENIAKSKSEDFTYTSFGQVKLDENNDANTTNPQRTNHHELESARGPNNDAHGQEEPQNYDKSNGEPAIQNGHHHHHNNADAENNDAKSTKSNASGERLSIAEINLDERSINESLSGKMNSMYLRSSSQHADLAVNNSALEFEFDQVIDKLRENQISNKDVCNYILNLLVGGEFDLEKNFIIKNVTSILKMIQVIKCANPALKVINLFVRFPKLSPKYCPKTLFSTKNPTINHFVTLFLKEFV